MRLVTTIGKGSMDLYSSKLAEHLHVPKLETDIYQRSAEVFNVPLVSKPSLSVLWRDLAFIRRLRSTRDTLHFPNHHLGRYALFTRQPHVITVHDLIRYFDLQGGEPLIHRPNLRDGFYLRLDYRGIRRAPAIIAISETTKRDLLTHLGLPAERVHVVYHGIDHELFHPMDERPYAGRYILFVGSEHPRKNLFTLLAAFKRMKQDARFSDVKLIKVGAAGGREAPFRAATLAAVAKLGLTEDVVFTERVPDEALAGYYAGAECFVLPSLYEGFGFPPLEAMACGCPVIVSDAGALPEIAGDAALVTPARDDAALADALIDLLTDASRRQRLTDAGLRRAANFTWEKAAAETQRVYEIVEAMDSQYAPLSASR